MTLGFNEDIRDGPYISTNDKGINDEYGLIFSVR